MQSTNDFGGENMISIDAAVELSVDHSKAVSTKQFEFHDIDLPRDFRTGDYLRDCPPNRRSGCASQGSRTSR